MTDDAEEECDEDDGEEHPDPDGRIQLKLWFRHPPLKKCKYHLLVFNFLAFRASLSCFAMPTKPVENSDMTRLFWSILLF